MAMKDLAAHFAPALELPYGGKTYVVQPPTKDVGLKLAAVNAMGVADYSSLYDVCPPCGHAGSVEVADDTRAIFESIEGTDVAVLSLGQGVYDEMIADGVPGPHLDSMALYALYFWTLGEETADAIFEAQSGGGASGGATGPSTSPRGPRTESANRTKRRASTRATRASRQR